MTTKTKKLKNPETKLARRRRNLLDQVWLRANGDHNHPRFMVKSWLNDMAK